MKPTKNPPCFSVGSSDLSDKEYLHVTLTAAADIMFLEEQEITVHSKDSEGDTPLHKACVWGDLRAVRVLLEAGARINEQGDMGATPLYFAVMFGFQNVADYLASKGADQNIRSEFGDTPLELSTLKGVRLDAYTKR